MFHIRFFFRDQSETLILDQNETISTAVTKLIPIFKLNLPLSSYLLQIPQKIEITEETIGSLFQTTDDLIDVHLTLKEDYDFIENFCNNVFPSLKYEALMMSPLLTIMLPNIHEMHKKIQIIYNCSYDFNSLIPPKIYEGKSELELIRSLLSWFNRNEIMKWYLDSLYCNDCHSLMVFVNRCPPTVSQKQKGADQCFLYQCKECERKKRFPNYNSVETLLEEKEGTSGGFCLVFGAILRYFGFDLRIVTILNSYINNYWLEVYIESLKKYVHVDPTLGDIDAPLHYEIALKPFIHTSVYSELLKPGIFNSIQNLNSNYPRYDLTRLYVVAVGLYDCMDVTPKYTQNIERIIWERSKEIPEEYFQQMIQMRHLMWSYGLEGDMKEKYDEIYYNELMNNHPPIEPPSKEEMAPITRIDRGSLFIYPTKY